MTKKRATGIKVSTIADVRPGMVLTMWGLTQNAAHVLVAPHDITQLLGNAATLTKAAIVLNALPSQGLDNQKRIASPASHQADPGRGWRGGKRSGFGGGRRFHVIPSTKSKKNPKSSGKNPGGHAQQKKPENRRPFLRKYVHISASASQKRRMTRRP